MHRKETSAIDGDAGACATTIRVTIASLSGVFADPEWRNAGDCLIQQHVREFLRSLLFMISA
jgi:hypothetical protein